MTVNETLAMRAMTTRADLFEAKYEALGKAIGELIHPLPKDFDKMQATIERATEVNEFCADTGFCGAIMAEDDEVCSWCGGPRRES